MGAHEERVEACAIARVFLCVGVCVNECQCCFVAIHSHSCLPSSPTTLPPPSSPPGVRLWAECKWGSRDRDECSRQLPASCVPKNKLCYGGPGSWPRNSSNWGTTISSSTNLHVGSHPTPPPPTHTHLRSRPQTCFCLACRTGSDLH